MIDVRAVGKRFGRVDALLEVSFQLETGRTAVLVGPSGSGKTTLLRLVAGLELPDAGEVLLAGSPASRPGWGIPPHDRGIGFVFQTPSLWPHLTVRGNVALALGRLARAERRLRVEQTLAQSSLGDLADRYPDELSGGEARRVALARALAPEPRILLLDEPLTNLDGPGRDQLLDLVLAAVQASGATLLYVTHRLEEAERLGGTPLRLDAGRLVCPTP
jgi:iron(III) transport system ATP-binding protein